MGEISSRLGIKDVALFGKGLHVVAEDSAAAASAILSRLAGSKYGVAHIDRIAPSLEDVFVSLIEARDRAEPPQPAVQT